MRYLLAAVVVLCQAFVVAHAQVLEDFESDREWFVVHSEKRGVTCQVVDAPMRQGKSLQVSWSPTRERYGEPYLRQPLPVPGFDTSSKPYHGRVEIDVFSPGTPEPRGMSVRLVDSANETFQWKIPVDLSEPGWKTISFELTPDNKTVSWGDTGKTEGVMDGPMRFMGITVDLDWEIQPSPDEAKRQIIVDNITMHLPKGASAAGPAPAEAAAAAAVDLGAIKVGLITGHPMHIVDPQSPQPAYLTLRSDAAQTQAVRLAIDARSLLGRTYSVALDLRLPAKQDRQQFLPLPQDKQDFWWVYYTLTDPHSGAERRGREMLGMMTPTGNNPTYQSQGRFLFGMCAHSGRYDDTTMQAEAYAAGLIGLDIMRSGMEWGSLQPAADTWRWEKMDRQVQLYKAQNIQIQYLFGYSAQWASTGDPNAKDWLVWSRSAPRLAPWQTYVREVTARYHQDIKHWELWNEPDLFGFFRSSADEYAALCTAAYPIIKSIDPSATVLTGGWSGMDRNLPFVEAALPQIREAYDQLAIHIHGSFGMFQKDVDGRWARLRERFASDKPIYFNETGISSPGDTIEGDTRQAIELVRKITFTMSRGAVAYNWYDLRHDGDDPNDHEHRYGIITRDFRAKPAYVAYNNLIRQLRGYQFVEQLESAPDQWLFLLKKDQDYIIVGWAQQPYAVGQVIVQTDAVDVHQVDIMGNTQAPVRLPTGGVVLSVESQPAYWVFHKTQTRPTCKDTLLQQQGIAAWIPGQINDLVFDFTNPLPREVGMIFEAQLPASLGGAVLKLDQTFPAGAKKTLRLSVAAPATGIDYARPFTCLLTYQDRNYQLKGTTPVSVRWAGTIARNGYGAQPTFVLDQDTQVFDIYRADPNSKDRIWQGPRDLSAQAWLAATATHLSVRVAVTDDLHVQEQPADMLWKSDSLQLAIQVPGQQGQWEINLARSRDGKPMLHAGIVPAGLDASGLTPSALTVATRDGKTLYDLALPLSTLKLTPQQLREGIGLSLLVNDDDGKGRDGWISLSGGIGEEKDPTQYPLFVQR